MEGSYLFKGETGKKNGALIWYQMSEEMRSGREPRLLRNRKYCLAKGKRKVSNS